MYTKPFSELSKGDASIAGGKGASLGEMTQAGIPVPPGFVVLADTFDNFLAETDLTQEIAVILETVQHDAMHTIEAASEKIQSLILSRPMPDTIRAEIDQQFQVLGAQYVAVRSSATAEDGADHAWAGQLESYLNTTHETLLAHVQKCWASLFTPRAIFYRFEKGLHSHHISVAVVVQTMVNSEKSGIAFSVHPVTEDRNQLIIEAGLGLGEAIVSGAVTPDSYVVSKVPREIIDINVNHQSRALYRDDAGGNVWRDLSPDHAVAQVLSTDEIQALSDIIVRIENHYGFPCDIEWAQEGEKFYIVQSRPITTLVASPMDFPENALEYEKHQRDYSVLGTAVVFNAYQSPQTESFFDISTKPYYILVENSVLYHFTPISESALRAVHYLRNNNVNDIRQHKKHHDDILGEYHSFLAQTTDNSRDAFEKLFSYFSRLLPVILVAIEVPEYAKDNAIVDVCLQIRRENEDVYKVGFDYLDAMLAAREKQDKLEPGTLSYLTQSEFFQYLTTKELPADVLRRKEFVFIEQHHESEHISYQRSDLVTRGLLSTEKTIDTNEIHGTVAYRGNVSGTVRIIRKVGDMDSVREGDILVASMTDPRYVLAMQKVSAIVTDEGGITCHAAIVAREMKKPCVIGTKIATQVLSDGDLVEVDAEKGVVRIITHT